MAKFYFENCDMVGSGTARSISGLSVEGGVIAQIGGEEREAASVSPTGSDLIIMPGFIDVHIHGAVGIDVNTADADGLMQVAGFLARNGVTSWMPTLVPDSDDNYERAIGAIDELMARQANMPIAQAVGVHYEGVFANEKMCGALRPEYFRSGRSVMGNVQLTKAKNHPVIPTKDVGMPPLLRKEGSLVGLPRLDRGVHMTTLAPEIEGGIELIEAIAAEGWVVAIGHTRADPETLDRAFAAGARHMTHFFNAMGGLHHRDVGAVGWGLANDGVTFDIIADGVHVHPSILRVACTAKTPKLVTLISDSVAPTGLGDGEYKLWGENISVIEGRTRNERGSIAGSVATLADCVRNLRDLGFSDPEVAMMASTNPAALLGLDDRGSIESGKRADLVGLDENGRVAFTMIGGRLVNA